MDKCCLFVCLFHLFFADIVITAKTELNLSSLILCAFTLFHQRFSDLLTSTGKGTLTASVSVMQHKE